MQTERTGYSAVKSTSRSRRPSAIGGRAYEFTLNSDGGDCDDPILWFFPCFHLAGVNSELKAPRRSAGCGGEKRRGGWLCCPRPSTNPADILHTLQHGTP